MSWEATKREARLRIEGEVRTLLDNTINHTANFVDERRGISGGCEFRVLTKAHGECIAAIRVESS